MKREGQARAAGSCRLPPPPPPPFLLPPRPPLLQTVDRVIIPGAEGVYGVTAGHTPIVSQLKSGVVEIVHDAGGEGEKYFVSGGFALTHDTSVTDISAFEVRSGDRVKGKGKGLGSTRECR